MENYDDNTIALSVTLLTSLNTMNVLKEQFMTNMETMSL